MPEVHFQIRWPDGTERRYYSPSTAVQAHLACGESYPLGEFMTRARAAMHAASERVRAKYGYACSSAMDTLAQLEQTARGFVADATQRVAVTQMDASTSEPPQPNTAAVQAKHSNGHRR